MGLKNFAQPTVDDPTDLISSWVELIKITIEIHARAWKVNFPRLRLDYVVA